ncbi:MAG: outer membrane protein assembly factor BamA, partial [Rhodospirillaceae bacterium]
MALALCFAGFGAPNAVFDSRAAELGSAPVELAQAAIIERISVQGAQRVEPGTVKSYLLVREGDPFNPLRIDRSLKSLFATGLFADVSIDRQGSALVVSVVENPIINRIAFEGNSAIENETLEAEVSLRPRVIYTRTKVQDDVKRILTLYQREGRFAVTVEPKVIQLPQNRVDLAFEIEEGEPTKVRSIRFVGNREYSDRQLRGIVRTKEAAWYRLFSTDDVYDPDRMTLDRELLRRHYLSSGFADFRVVSAVAELTPDRKDFFVTFGVAEGERYKVGGVTVEARLRDLKAEDIKQVVEMEPGQWYDIRDVDKAIEKITERVGELGYAFV